MPLFTSISPAVACNKRLPVPEALTAKPSTLVPPLISISVATKTIAPSFAVFKSSWTVETAEIAATLSTRLISIVTLSITIASVSLMKTPPFVELALNLLTLVSKWFVLEAIAKPAFKIKCFAITSSKVSSTSVILPAVALIKTSPPVDESTPALIWFKATFTPALNEISPLLLVIKAPATIVISVDATKSIVLLAPVFSSSPFVSKTIFFEAFNEVSPTLFKTLEFKLISLVPKAWINKLPADERPTLLATAPPSIVISPLATKIKWPPDTRSSDEPSFAPSLITVPFKAPVVKTRFTVFVVTVFISISPDSVTKIPPVPMFADNLVIVVWILFADVPKKPAAKVVLTFSSFEIKSISVLPSAPESAIESAIKLICPDVSIKPRVKVLPALYLIWPDPEFVSAPLVIAIVPVVASISKEPALEVKSPSAPWVIFTEASSVKLPEPTLIPLFTSISPAVACNKTLPAPPELIAIALSVALISIFVAVNTIEPVPDVTKSSWAKSETSALPNSWTVITPILPIAIESVSFR